MDRELWGLIRSVIRRADRHVCRTCGPEKKVQVSSTQVVAMHLWQVYHDRTLSWACQRSSYGGVFRPRKLLSISQYSRRVKSPRVQRLLTYMQQAVSRADGPVRLSYFDGKLLPVAMHSKDRQATKVRTNHGYVRGYRLHAWATDRGFLPVWSVTGAHEGEQTVARRLCPHLPPMAADALVLGDVRFDSAKLYADVAVTGATRLTPLQAISQVPRKRQAMGPARRAAVEAWEQTPAFVRQILHERGAIERIFGTLSGTAGGLGPLPAWVRGLDRVRRWVGIKVILYNARLRLRHARKRAA